MIYGLTVRLPSLLVVLVVFVVNTERSKMILYNFAVSLAVWFVLVPWELMNVWWGNSNARRLSERLGKGRAGGAGKRYRILVHAVSVGEVGVAGAILRLVEEQERDVEVLLTVGNRAGFQSGERLQRRLNCLRQVLFLPWDRRRAMLGWLKNCRPDLAVIVETEIWPNFFYACKELDVPLYIVNGRIYPGDLGRYRVARPFFRKVLDCAGWIGVQNEEEKNRFEQIGADRERLHVIGNAKFDQVLAPADIPQVWRQALKEARLTVAAGSTHPPEERWILESLKELESPGTRLILAPRVQNRCGAIAGLARDVGLKTAIWSKPEKAPSDWDVLLVDQLGWLPALYEFADIAFVGGSLVRKGGHNFLEAARCAKAIIIGPHADHFGDLVAQFRESDALIQLGNRNELAPALRHLIQDPQSRKALGERAIIQWQSGRGAAAHYARALGQERGSRKARK